MACLLAGSVLCTGLEVSSAEDMRERMAEVLRRRLSRPDRQEYSFCRKEALCGQGVLARFYDKRDFLPAWSDPQGRFPQATELLHTIQQSNLQGLKPDVYHLATIESLLESIAREREQGRPLDPAVLADLDLLLTDGFFIYGSHLLSGRVDPETIHARWSVNSREADLADLLQSALAHREVGKALQGLLPKSPAYARLREALQQYREITAGGGWPSLPAGATLHKDDRSRRVPSLRARLSASGDLDESEAEDPERFDEGLETAVRRFQERHGLTVDGVVGRATRAALNVPAEERVRQIELNMERWRWLPDDLGRRYVLINTADFSLQVVEDGTEVLAMRVVVGRKARRTPVFSGTMTYLDFNPYWNIPHKLAVRDIVPKIKTDPAYLDRQGIRVFASWEASAPEIPSEAIDWSKVTKHSFAFKLRQDPGPTNALGRIKFMFPNKFAVYLHDTPSRYMFKRKQRDFSSGCIRIEAPIDLAAYLLRGEPKWTREGITAAIESGENRTVWLPESIPVHVLYWTAWVGPEHRVCFREDVYGRDDPLDRALHEGPVHYQ
jgi:murein L,D-transpeptidase YcbB/YkuD